MVKPRNSQIIISDLGNRMTIPDVGRNFIKGAFSLAFQVLGTSRLGIVGVSAARPGPAGMA